MLHIFLLEILRNTQDKVLLWRGVLRIANEYLQLQIQPSKLKWPKPVLAPRDLQKFNKMEKEEDCIGAMEKLIEKLLELGKPDWPELFLKSLEPCYPNVARALSSLAEQLKTDIFGDVTFDMGEGGYEQGMGNVLFYYK